MKAVVYSFGRLEDKCTGCGDCINACPVRCFEMSDSKNLPYSRPTKLEYPVTCLQEFYGDQIAALKGLLSTIDIQGHEGRHDLDISHLRFMSSNSTKGHWHCMQGLIHMIM